MGGGCCGLHRPFHKMLFAKDFQTSAIPLRASGVSGTHATKWRAQGKAYNGALEKSCLNREEEGSKVQNEEATGSGLYLNA